MFHVVRIVRVVRNVRTVQSVRIVLIVLIVLTALAHTAGRIDAQGSGILVRHRAPTDRALDFQLAALQAEFADMKATTRASTRLVEGGTYSMNARYLTGTEAAQIHKSITEFYFVRDGSATLVTGGAIVNKAIRGGVERVIKAGDVVFIPPGVPHAIRETAGISYLNIHFGGTD
jgi:mannose-6-phosphate isomerase-like protein (cupin superfamily)